MIRMISFWKHLQDWSSPIIQETVKLPRESQEECYYSCFTILSKIAEVLGETNDFSASTVQRKSALSKILKSQWYSNRIRYSQGKLRLFITLKVNVSNPSTKNAGLLCLRIQEIFELEAFMNKLLRPIKIFDSGYRM